MGSGAATGVTTGAGDGVDAGVVAGGSEAVWFDGPEQEAIVAITGTAITSAMMIAVFLNAPIETRRSRMRRP